MICSITSLYVVYVSYRFLFLDKFHGFVCITHRYFNDITTFRQIGDIYGGFFRNFNNLLCQIIYGNGRVFVDTVYIKVFRLGSRAIDFMLSLSMPTIVPNVMYKYGLLSMAPIS